MSGALKIVLAFSFLAIFAECSPTNRYVPIVLWHGMGDSSHGRGLNYIMQTLAEDLPGVYVTSLQLGETEKEEILNSVWLNVNTQVEEACKIVREDPKLRDGFNAIGFSQGGQFLRALVQRCPEAHVKTLITIGSQHHGTYGIPKCSSDRMLCNAARRIFTWIAYSRFFQPINVQAQYWKDPLNEQSYLRYNTFLADINNEGFNKNATYAKKLASLDKFVMVRFNKDEMIAPTETSWFGFYKPGQAKEVQPMNETTVYKEGWLGLDILDKKGALHFLELDAFHLRFDMAWFRSQIINNYLR